MLGGTPDLSNKPHQMQSTSWGRSETLPLMRLDRAAASNAIRFPLEAAGRRITANALERLVVECHGYSYFRQLWGRTFWDEAPTPLRRARERFPRGLMCGGQSDGFTIRVRSAERSARAHSPVGATAGDKAAAAELHASAAPSGLAFPLANAGSLQRPRRRSAQPDILSLLRHLRHASCALFVDGLS